MSRNDFSTIEEALAYLHESFIEQDGVVARIERGEVRDVQQMQGIEQAYRFLQHTWQDQTMEPKQAVQVLHAAACAMSRLEQHLWREPSLAPQGSDFLQNVIMWSESVFLAFPESMAEDTALSLLYQHTIGLPSFNVALLEGHIDQNAFRELLAALETLANVWSGRPAIAKLAAHAFTSTPSLFRHVAQGFSYENQSTLVEMEQTLHEQIERCLRIP